jgi:hypothetical protein
MGSRIEPKTKGRQMSSTLVVRPEIAPTVLCILDDERAIFDDHAANPYCVDISKALARVSESVRTGKQIDLSAPLFPSDRTIPGFVNVGMHLRHATESRPDLAGLAVDIEGLTPA